MYTHLKGSNMLKQFFDGDYMCRWIAQITYFCNDFVVF
jgi:hypothetical protein